MTGEPREIRNLARVGDDVLRPLHASLARVRTVADLIEWARARVPPASIEDIVTQDEYTHDVLVAIEPPLWLAFDVT